MEDIFKRTILAGIGSLAMTYDKANKLVNELVEKGQLTVNQGKELNEELKRTIEKNKADKDLEVEDYVNSLNLATKTDMENLNKRIYELEKRINGGI